MSKKNSILALMLLACMAGYAQSDKSSSASLQNEASKVISERTRDLLTNMQKKLKGQKTKVEFGNIRKTTRQQQFLFEEGKIDTLLKPKSLGLGDVFTKLCSKENEPTDFRFEELTIKEDNIHYKIFETGKKQGAVDSSKLVVPVSFNTHTVAKNNISDVEYSVVLEWEVSVRKKTSNNKGDKTITYTVDNPVLISSTASPLKKNKESGASAIQKDPVLDSLMSADTVSGVTEDTIVIAEKPQDNQFSKPIEVVLEYAFQISNYVSNANEKTQKKIEHLFVNADAEIEVSVLQWDGTEKIWKRSVKEYLSLLKGKSLKISLDGVDNDNGSFVYTASQAYRSDSYNDDTQKMIYLMYNADKKTYLIKKITVVPNSTKINKQ